MERAIATRPGPAEVAFVHSPGRLREGTRSELPLTSRRTNSTAGADDPSADPFRETSSRLHTRQYLVLGAQIRFESDHPALLRLADAAFGGLPRHRLFAHTPRLCVSLRFAQGDPEPRWRSPPPLRFHSANGLICATAAAGDYVIVSVAQRAALVVISPRMLRHPYHARYELIEFAAYTLATRCLPLVPLHAACLGNRGRGVLVVGDSGAGKSTLTLLGLLAGMKIVAEDSVLVEPRSMRATGTANFLHVQRGRWGAIQNKGTVRRLQKSPLIVRRSGVVKHEIDLRAWSGSAASTPLRIVAVVLLSRAHPRGGPPIQPIGARVVERAMVRTQAYARSQSTWSGFLRQVLKLPAYRLKRTSPADRSVSALWRLIAANRRSATG